MGKLLFVDLDDCIVESSPLIQAAFDEKTVFKNGKLEVLEFILASCKEVYEKNVIEVERALQCNEKPKLIGNVKVGSNDIMKTSLIDSPLDENEKQKRRYYRWYKKPIEVSRRSYEEAYKSKEMFLEARDYFLEKDNQSSIEDAIVDYRSIYNSNNLTFGAVDMVNELIDSNEYDGYYCLSHHNGGREEYQKASFINSIFNGRLQFMGLRFHLEEHKDGIRRLRSSKALYVMNMFGLSDLSNCVLIDDSTVNLDDWIKYGGMAILYRPISEDEEYYGKLEPHGDQYPRITKMDKEQLEEALKFYEKKQRVLKKV